MLLPLAVKARLPLVGVETDDPLNIRLVLAKTLGTEVKAFPTSKGADGKTLYDPKSCKKDGLYVMRKPNMDGTDWEGLYGVLANLQATTIVVNPSKPRPEIFRAGFIACPENLIREFVAKHSDAEEDSEDFEALVSALSGLSYQSVVQITLLAQANSGSFSARAVREVRRVFFGEVRGLRQENTEVAFYAPKDDLVQWLALDGALFAANAPPELRARGLLFDGPPGTGKTEGAKYIARELGLPLYRLDIGATMNKYVGESEKGLEQALAQADRCAPCVMLIDEVEKIFGGNFGGDSGVSTRALSTLLWWLQEHQSRVLTIMTTNAKKKLPPELIRTGRIDRQLYLGPLGSAEGLDFMRTVADKFKNVAKLTPQDVGQAHAAQYPIDAPDTSMHSHAHLTGVVMGLIKAKYLSAISKTSKKEVKA